MTRKDNIRSLINKNNRRLQKLKEQKASMGLHTYPHILTEIEDIELELENLKAELRALRSIDIPQDEIQKDEKNDLKLIDSFPKDNKPITRDDIKKIFLRFDKPIDFESTKYISNYYVRTNSFCQWNICGWIQMAESDKKLIWHVKEHLLANLEEYGSQDVDYHTFEIHIGREPHECRVRSKDGNKLPLTKVRVKIAPKIVG